MAHVVYGRTKALERDPHTIGRWASAFGEGGPAALIFEQSGGSPPRLTRGSGRSGPTGTGKESGSLSERFGTSLSRSSCLNWLHRLGSAFKRSQGGRGQAEVIRGGVRRPVGRGGEAKYSLLMRPTSGGTVGCWLWWTPPARGMGRRPALLGVPGDR